MKPCSTTLFDEQIEHFLKNYSANSYFDIGAGTGKFGKMIHRINPKAYITALEPDKTLDLKEYDMVINETAEEFIGSLDFDTDVVIMGDVLEHLKKSEGIDFINYILYRCKVLICKYPPMYVQPADKSKFEAHISMWFPKEFDQFNCPIITNRCDDYMCLTILKGLPGVLEDYKKEKK